MTSHVLAGDIGGTKTTLAMYEITTDDPRRVREATFASGAYPSLEPIVRELLRDSKATRVDRACFAVAGPVDRGTASITNLPWTLDERALAAALDIPSVTLINDVQASAYGMLFVAPESFANLRESARSARSTIAVIAPGTGLGEALLYWDGSRHHAIASEGGHADFAAQTDDEIALLRFLQRQFEHVSCERVLSGAGIGSIYSFLRAGGPAEPAWLTERLASGDRNAAISEVALAKRDPLCVRALDMFCAALGAETANVALRCVATGGVIIGGGIAPQILPLLGRGPFFARFAHKGRFSRWLEGISVRVALDEQAPLLGAAHWTSREETP